MDIAQWYSLRLEALQLARDVLNDPLKHTANTPEEVVATAEKFLNFIVHGKLSPSLSQSQTSA